MVKDRYKFTFTFEGEAFEDNSIDVRQLAPTMLSLGKLFEDSNALLNHNRTKASLKATATNKGSFEIQLVLDQTLIDAAIDFFKSSVIDAEVIAAYLFFDVDARISLTTLIKLLKGKWPTDTVDKGENIEIRQGNSSVLVYKPVYNLYLDGKVRNDMSELVEPLYKEGVERLQITGTNKKQTIAKEEKESYIVEDYEDVVESDNEIEQLLKIVNLSDPHDYKWRLNDGERTYYYSIIDDEFIARVEKGKSSLYMIC
jgi:hypothetical protein